MIGIPEIRTVQRRVRNHGAAIVIFDAVFLDRPSDEASWAANCRRLAAEANAEKLFRGAIDPTLVSLICREQLQPAGARS